MVKRVTTYLFLTIFLMMFLSVSGHGYEVNTKNDYALNDEVNHLKATHEAVLLSEKELNELRGQEDSSESDILEFDQFVNDLKIQILEGCESVRLLGHDGNHYGVNCAELENDPAITKNGNVADMQREATREEQAHALAGKLRKLESDLDGMFLKEQEKIKAEQGFSESVSSAGGRESAGQMQEGEGSSSGKESGHGEEGESQEGGGSEAAKVSSGSEEGDAEGGASEQSQFEDGKTGQGANNYGAGPGGGGIEGGVTDLKKETPGDSRDDDVIARQLREAAEAETDEELQEKLWEEYRKYKKNKR